MESLVSWLTYHGDYKEWAEEVGLKPSTVRVNYVAKLRKEGQEFKYLPPAKQGKRTDLEKPSQEIIDEDSFEDDLDEDDDIPPEETSKARSFLERPPDDKDLTPEQYYSTLIWRWRAEIMNRSNTISDMLDIIDDEVEKAGGCIYRDIRGSMEESRFEYLQYITARLLKEAEQIKELIKEAVDQLK